MRRGHVLGALLVLTTCGRDLDRESIDDRVPSLHLVGSVTCATCPTVRFRLAGAGLDRVVAAELLPRDGTPVAATTSLRLVPGARPELEVVASLRAPAAPGDYDLRLRLERTGRDAVLLLRDALRVPARAPSAGVVRSGE